MRTASNLALSTQFELDADLTHGTGGIRPDARLIRRLLDDLYSNKEDAVVRELSANCFDAHKAAGTTDIPFTATGPTALDPYLTFEDQGTGLSHEFMTGRYMWLGDSTKQQENSSIGGFGLGGKTQLAIVNMYEVSSRYQGVETHYVIMWGPDETKPQEPVFCDTTGEPTGEMAYPETILVKTMGQNEATKPDGLTVRIQVPEERWNAINKALQNRLWRFSPQPITNVTLRSVETLVETPLFTLRKQNRHGHNSAVAVMGSIAYPIQTQHMDMPWGSPAHRVLNSSIDIQFNIGEIDPALNREALNYNAKTKAAINRKVQSVVDTLKAEVEKKLAASPSYWEACKLWKEIDSDVRDVLMKEPPLYQGKSVNTAIDGRIHNQVSWMHRSDVVQNPNAVAPPLGTYCHMDGKDTNRVNPPLSFETGQVRAVPGVTTFVWWPEDLEITNTSARRRLKEWGIAGHHDLIILKGDATFRDHVLNTVMGGAPLTATLGDAEMPEPPKATWSRAGGGPTTRAPLAKFHVYNVTCSRFEERQMSPSDGGVYVVVFNWEPVRPDKMPSIGIKALASMCSEFLGQELICIPSTYKTTPDKYPGWTEAHGLLKAKAMEIVKCPDHRRNRAVASLFNEVNTSALDKAVKMFAEAQVEPDPKGLMAKVVAERSRLREIANVSRFSDLARRMIEDFGLKFEPIKVPNKYKELVSKFEAKYPLLNYVNDPYYRSEREVLAKHIVNYINA